MNEKLALTGSKLGVNQTLKVKWPIITQADKKAVMGL